MTDSKVELFLCKPVFLGLPYFEMDTNGRLKDGKYGKLYVATNSVSMEKILADKNFCPAEIVAYIPKSLPRKDDVFVTAFMELVYIGLSCKAKMSLSITGDEDISEFVDMYQRVNQTNQLKFIKVSLDSKLEHAIYNPENNFALVLQKKYNNVAEYIEDELFKRMVRDREDF